MLQRCLHWIKSDNTSIMVKNMHFMHIINSLRCLNNNGKRIINDQELIEKTKYNRSEWITIFQNEISYRYNNQ